MNKSFLRSCATARIPPPEPSLVQRPGLIEASREADDSSSLDVALTVLLCLAFVAAMAALGIWLLRADATDRPPANVTQGQSGGRSQGLLTPQAVVGAMEGGKPDPALPHVRRDIERFALNYLLLPLIDDTHPMRWADPSLGLVCGGASQVLVDGRPLEVGAPLPTKGFAVQLLLSRCSPAVEDSLEFHGAVDMLVSHASGQLRALVQPRHLTVLTAHGRTSLTAPFTACLALDEASACEQLTVVAARPAF
jgi:hypothetical protein